MTSNQSGSTQTPVSPLPTGIVVGVCVLSALVLIGGVVLLVTGHPVDNLLVIVAAVIMPTITALLAAKKIGDAQSVLHDVSVKVNGRLDGALNAISALEAQVRESGGVPVTQPLFTTPSPIPRHSAENPPADVSDPITMQEVASNG